MNEKYVVALSKKLYEDKSLSGFKLAVYSYNKATGKVKVDRVGLNMQEFYTRVKNNQFYPINFSVGITGRVTELRSVNNYDGLIERVLKVVRSYIVAVSGRQKLGSEESQEACEFIKAILNDFGYMDVRVVNGMFTSPAGTISHSWILLNRGMTYVDVTMDQFNYLIAKEYQFKELEKRDEVPSCLTALK